MLNVFHSRRRLLVAGILLLAGGVAFQQRHRATTPPHDYPPTELPEPVADVRTEFVMTNKNFAAQVDLWPNPGIPVYDTDISYANYVFQSALHPVDFAQLAAGVKDFNGPAPYRILAVKDPGYSLISIGTFKAGLTLTPTKAKPEDLFPTQLKPGLDGSFDF
jgi:hypothetical protein